MRKEVFGILSLRETKIIVVLYGYHLFLKRKRDVFRYCNVQFLPARSDTKGHVTAVGSCRLGTLRYSDPIIMLGHGS